MNNNFRALGVVILCLISYSALSDPATDAEMAQDALAPFVGSRISASERLARIQRLHHAVRERAIDNPKVTSSGTVVFKHGLSIRRTVKMAEQFQLEVTGINVKAPLNERGIVQSLLIGSYDLLRYDGPLETRIEFAIGYYRHRFLQRAELETEDVAEDLRKMAKSPMRIYAFDVIGPAETLLNLTAHPSVVLVTIDPSERSKAEISAYLSLKKDHQEAWRDFEDSLESFDAN